MYDVAVAMAETRPRSLIVAELEERGLSVCAWPDTTATLRALLTGEADARVVVLDLGGESGLSPEQAAQVARALNGRRLILLMSAYGGDRYAEARRHAFAVLVRPFRVGDVVQVVEEALTSPRTSRTDTHTPAR
ncbi:MAG: hypothetical protein QHH80_04820 [Anaerolineae bacterium]|nr:hypothetical protein [Anaerolineae bacterium]